MVLMRISITKSFQEMNRGRACLEGLSSFIEVQDTIWGTFYQSHKFLGQQP